MIWDDGCWIWENEKWKMKNSKPKATVSNINPR
jgi:hypothetical protein